MNNLNILSFAFVDTALFAATMTLKYGRHFDDDDQPRHLSEPPFHGCRHIILRGPEGGEWGVDGAHVDHPLLEAWPSARKLIEDVREEIHRQLGAQNLAFGKVYVESLLPVGRVDWHIDDSPYGRQHVRFRLLAAPCAGGLWFSGNESLAPGVGNLTFVNHLALHSAINLGPVPQISLVVDARKPQLQ
jgi:hypothetical protein